MRRCRPGCPPGNHNNTLCQLTASLVFPARSTGREEALCVCPTGPDTIFPDLDEPAWEDRMFGPEGQMLFGGTQFLKIRSVNNSCGYCGQLAPAARICVLSLLITCGWSAYALRPGVGNFFGIPRIHREVHVDPGCPPSYPHPCPHLLISSPFGALTSLCWRGFSRLRAAAA